MSTLPIVSRNGTSFMLVDAEKKFYANLICFKLFKPSHSKSLPLFTNIFFLLALISGSPTITTSNFIW